MSRLSSQHDTEFDRCHAYRQEKIQESVQFFERLARVFPNFQIARRSCAAINCGDRVGRQPPTGSPTDRGRHFQPLGLLRKEMVVARGSGFICETQPSSGREPIQAKHEGALESLKGTRQRVCQSQARAWFLTSVKRLLTYLNVRGILHAMDDQSKDNERLLRKKEVAELFACSLRSVDRLVARGKLTRVKILGGVRFRLSEVQAIING